MYLSSQKQMRENCYLCIRWQIRNCKEDVMLEKQLET